MNKQAWIERSAQLGLEGLEDRADAADVPFSAVV